MTYSGDAGDQSIVPELAQYLASPGLQAATEQAMWAIFHRNPNPAVSELMNQVYLDCRAHAICGANALLLLSRSHAGPCLRLSLNAAYPHRPILVRFSLTSSQLCPCRSSACVGVCKSTQSSDRTSGGLWLLLGVLSALTSACLLRQGCRLMTHAPQLVAAKELFTAVTKMEPSFAEAWPRVSKQSPHSASRAEACLHRCSHQCDMHSLLWLWAGLEQESDRRIRAA